MKKLLPLLQAASRTNSSGGMTHEQCKKACDPYAVESWSTGSYSNTCHCNNQVLQDYPERVQR